MSARPCFFAAARLGAALAAAAALWAGCAVASDRWGADYFPNVPLVTQDGKPVRFYDDLLRGKSVVVNLIYTQCSSQCPLETANLAQVQRLLGDRVGKDIFFYSISIDPFDTPALLKAYAAKFGVGPGWLFLTGKQSDIALIGRKLGLASLNDAADRDGHQGTLMIGNEPGGLWLPASGTDNPRFLATKIGLFLADGTKPSTISSAGYAAAQPIQGLEAGQYIFNLRCSGCHTIGRGQAIGPDLAGVTMRRQRGWLERYLAQPDAVLAERDPTAVSLFARYRPARMPNLRLGRDDIAALLTYLARQ